MMGMMDKRDHFSSRGLQDASRRVPQHAPPSCWLPAHWRGTSRWRMAAQRRACASIIGQCQPADDVLRCIQPLPIPPSPCTMPVAAPSGRYPACSSFDVAHSLSLPFSVFDVETTIPSWRDRALVECRYRDGAHTAALDEQHVATVMSRKCVRSPPSSSHSAALLCTGSMVVDVTPASL